LAFFNEEEEGIFLRCSIEFSDGVREWLESNGYKFTWKSYKEDSYIVTMFPDYFMQIFHLNALMAIDFYKGDFIPVYKKDEAPSKKQVDMAMSAWVGGIVERLSHCFLNNLQDFTHKYKEQSELTYGDDKAWESYILAEMIIGRSMWTGLRKAYLDAKERKENNDTNQER